MSFLLHCLLVADAACYFQSFQIDGPPKEAPLGFLSRFYRPDVQSMVTEGKPAGDCHLCLLCYNIRFFVSHFPLGFSFLHLFFKRTLGISGLGFLKARCHPTSLDLAILDVFSLHSELWLSVVKSIKTRPCSL